jgi:DNA-directed RNA polymerase specialized sigma subunit
MTQADSDRKVEDFFRSYRKLQLKLEILEPRYGQWLKNPTEWLEQLVIKRVEIKNQIRLIELSLDLLTRDERTFVEYRYFQEVPMREIGFHMEGWSEREIYRLRRSVLAKTAWIVGNGGEENVKIR